ncbi:hypothetical protein JD974_06720 [Chromobacterium haemolyticum]|uniref:Uncharacterized protein n=1 Tax=Chromobacterium haemolyticum TaxID=394935 RepID=A0ABS3GJJ4_9NEIS|nr:hypothetical protein [Chromobacterium haemolyticum]MBK0414097.1 hypothetical protein [Chromobacterium haemolyticum]MBO0415216.1 hypothetical protein [Chromobacterium haemolyticum]MBO0498477.1 hypothetical protein [Chromobacterium haemolyticum]BBH12338.1 hypothetical protein CH06BL_15860 [Chromobacterium haemolyticum]
MKLATHAMLLACLCLPALAQETATPSAPASKSSLSRLPGQDVWQVRDYDADEDSVRTFRYVLQNKIDPRLRNTIETGADQQLSYRYRLSNGQPAVQNIDYFWICCVPIQAFVIPESEEFPKKTGDKVTDEAAMAKWNQRSEARAELIVRGGHRYLLTPEAWRPNFKQGEGSAGYGWQPRPGYKPYGMPPGGEPADFAILRPELPGVRIATLQGFSGIDQFPGSYAIDSDDPAIKAEITAIARADGRWLPVLVPVLAVAEPFDAQDFSAQLWTEIETWYRDDDYSLSLLAPAVYGQLKREFDPLRAALAVKQTGAAQASIARLLTYLAQITAPDSVIPDNAGQDLAANETTPFATTRAPVTDPDSPDAATRGIHRVAAHALVFNLHYLQKRLAQKE